jgi:ribosome-associated protein
MTSKNDLSLSEKLSQVVVKGMQEKKASDITVMDLSNVKNSVADYFVICTGNSDTQLDAIYEAIDEEVHKVFNESPWHSEGRENKEWILLDYINVVAHIFQKEKRKFFSLETLWGDAQITNIEDLQ